MHNTTSRFAASAAKHAAVSFIDSAVHPPAASLIARARTSAGFGLTIGSVGSASRIALSSPAPAAPPVAMLSSPV